MTKTKFFLVIFTLLASLMGCRSDYQIDTNESIPENNWTYAKTAKTTLEVKDPQQAYQVEFKLRHTSAYRYSNLFVVMTLKGEGLYKNTRYQFKLAKADGEWLGKGSGDIFSYSFPLLKDHRFAKAGKYEISIEQNMRDNPLLGISDIGIRIKNK